jgi:hypothetical protein
VDKISLAKSHAIRDINSTYEADPLVVLFNHTLESLKGYFKGITGGTVTKVLFKDGRVWAHTRKWNSMYEEYRVGPITSLPLEALSKAKKDILEHDNAIFEAIKRIQQVAPEQKSAYESLVRAYDTLAGFGLAPKDGEPQGALAIHKERYEEAQASAPLEVERLMESLWLVLTESDEEEVED